jgi:hypothetical protein
LRRREHRKEGLIGEREWGDQGKRRRYDEEYGEPRRHSAEDDYYYQGKPGIREPQCCQIAVYTAILLKSSGK